MKESGMEMYERMYQTEWKITLFQDFFNVEPDHNG